ncbi:uncharacterized protein PRCAT00001113001 [Priceomyces carsonii]|uniref:uncharacterized protein n=1 Tax=Priceomyces carsonii TaxID=28549 RepID=UPI002ED9D2AB|nr:unnamed protein product [Priceomyces carsonii]
MSSGESKLPEINAYDKDRNSSREVEDSVGEEASQNLEPSSDNVIVDKDTLRERLQLVPAEKLRNIITDQIDLEVRLKHRELRLTEEELGKCESQMLTLRKFLEVPSNSKLENEPDAFTLKYHNVLNKSLSINYSHLKNLDLNTQSLQLGIGYGRSRSSEDVSQAPIHSYRTRSTTSSLRPSITAVQKQSFGCLYRRTDGVIVKLTCPDCQRSNFSSAQGFLNHSRIAHSKEYTSQDAAALACGEILPDVKQDEEGLASIENLKEKTLDPNKNLNVSEIYFDGLSHTLNTVHSNPNTSAGQTSIRDKSISPLDVEEKLLNSQSESELMKKIIKSGCERAEYEEMIDDARNHISNSHLFEDEEEEEVEEEEEKDGSSFLGTLNSHLDVVPGKAQERSVKHHKRRISRSGINIPSTAEQVSNPGDKAVSASSSSTPEQPPCNSSLTNSLPKLKLKLRQPHLEDIKRRKKER